MSLLWSVLLAAAVPAAPIQFTEGEATAVGANRRTVVRRDRVEAAWVEGAWPATGWEPIKANKDGWFEGRALSGGYARFTIDAPAAKTYVLEAVGHGMVYVNGAPRAGDPYGYGYLGLPVQLRAGKNEFVFASGRGRLSAKLVEPPAPVFLDVRDATLPDFREGVKGDVWAGIIVANTEASDVEGYAVVATGKTGSRTTRLPRIPALSVRKVPVMLRPDAEGKLQLRLVRQGRTIQSAAITVRVRKAGQAYKRTFFSDVDGSVQYYGVNPSTQPSPGQAMFLTLHGASVEGIGQAEAYAPKAWGNLVAPTNRRPYGFDWEDVGRLDALEVLAHAEKELKTDPRRTYLTGHSMGGHGTWHLGSLYPDRFAAIAPCAGWISFASYAGGAEFGNSLAEAVLARAGSPGDTLSRKYNFSTPAIFALHGDADDNVPVTEPRTMRKELEGIAPRFLWHEEKGQGHWYDTTPEPGADCIDYPGIFDLFAETRVPTDGEVRDLDFSTSNPGVSAKFRWAMVEQQLKPFALSRIQLTADPHRRAIRGTTQNVARMTLRTDALVPGADATFELDGQKLTLPWPKSGEVTLARTGEKWGTATAAPAEKSPSRSGGFKDVFRNRVLFVYGTSGSAEENEWARSKARFDAETFYYRGNGAVDVIPDSAYEAKKFTGRNVLLYGNADTNRAWAGLMDAEVSVRRGSATIGGRKATGDDLAIFVIRPNPNSTTASVAAIAPTGAKGARLAERVPIFLSGASIPDLLGIRSRMLTEGAAGIEVAGFFGNDWSTAKGDFAWKL